MIFKLLIEGQHRTLREELRLELFLISTCMRVGNSDVHEGIRAILIDKDKQPKWTHKSI